MNNFASVPTPKPSMHWRSLPAFSRKAIVSRSSYILVMEAWDDGQVIVELSEPMSAAMRGTLLLDFEADIKENIDPGLTVWLRAAGDKNPLRNLRGIEIKHE
jgi:hypothetical protein